MKAILLVAGYATRLYPLTKDRPKALLPVGGKLMLDYILDQINKIDEIDEVFVVSNHKFISQFEAWVKNADTKKKLSLLDDGSTDEDNRLGAIGDIYYAVDNGKIDDDLLIICGDNLFTFDLGDYNRFFKQAGKDCVCSKRVSDAEEIKGYAVALVDKDGIILDLEEKPANPKSDLAIFATYFYQKSTVPMFKQYLDEGNKPDAPGYFLQWLYTRKHVMTYEMGGLCYDVGAHKAYEEVQRVFS